MNSPEADLPNVCVLGCGPAGLLAARAASSLGLSVTIVSRKVKSDIRGAQFLHEPVDGITNPEPDFIIDIRHWGDASGYAKKVYGDPDAPTSWSSYGGPVPAWDLAKAYDKLWDLYGGDVKDYEMSPDVVERAVENFDYVISSIPLPALAEAMGLEGDFISQSVWISRKLTFSLPRSTIVYNGGSEDWYRASNIGGVAGMEYGFDPGFGVKIKKPLRHTLNKDELGGIFLVGRYGRWEKGVLAHHAYTDTLKVLEP